jgi:GMP synthase (glutamine-hydrolysing)
MRILSVLHPGGGHSGVLRECAAAGAHELVEWAPGRGDDVPGPLGEFDALAVFGGAMNVTERDRLPWLTGEIELIREALERHTPVIGICLGAQLLAAAAGGEVYRAAAPETGWYDVERLPASDGDPVLGGLPERFLAYQWHSYACRLPPGAVELAVSPICSQAYVIDGRAWGVQFHPEVTPDVLDQWFGEFGDDPDAVRLGLDADTARAELPERLGPWNEIGRQLFGGWLQAAAVRAPA